MKLRKYHIVDDVLKPSRTGWTSVRYLCGHEEFQSFMSLKDKQGVCKTCKRIADKTKGD